jgi:hypothetical protein
MSFFLQIYDMPFIVVIDSADRRAVSADQPAPYEIDSIKTEYHPNSGRVLKIDKFEDYQMHDAEADPPPVSDTPWWPFRSRTDFEFAEIALEAALTQKQVDGLIKILTRCISGSDSFNLSSHRDLKETWESASALHTPVAT